MAIQHRTNSSDPLSAPAAGSAVVEGRGQGSASTVRVTAEGGQSRWTTANILLGVAVALFVGLLLIAVATGERVDSSSTRITEAPSSTTTPDGAD